MTLYVMQHTHQNTHTHTPHECTTTHTHTQIFTHSQTRTDIRDIRKGRIGEGVKGVSEELKGQGVEN